jgi:alginate O-acetyltransferase complex protein AlgI
MVHLFFWNCISVNTETTGNYDGKLVGWIFYDADCRICAGSARQAASLLERYAFALVPLQAPGTPERFGVEAADLLSRMLLISVEGRRFAGADAFVEIARHIGWAKPLALLARLPGALPLLRRAYDWFADHRYCLGGTCHTPRRRRWLEWLPLMLLPMAAFALRGRIADWGLMWAVAFALFAGCKWLTYRKATAKGVRFTLTRSWGYLAAWVGMEARPFAADVTATPHVSKQEWFVALGQIAAGISLVWGAVRFIPVNVPLLAGWVGMFGIILLLHFGAFQLLALVWRRAGIPVEPLMRAPLMAKSVGDFWGARWNTGFHVLAHQLLYRSLHKAFGRKLSVLGVFLISGIIHDLVITVPARGGYGLPTAYFLLQGAGLLLERSALGRSFGLGVGIRGRLYAYAVTAGPAFWLFPPVFVHRIILPMLAAIGAT